MHAPLQAHRAPVRSLLVQGAALWSGSTDGTVRSWDLAQLGAPSASPATQQAMAFEEWYATGARPPSAAAHPHAAHLPPHPAGGGAAGYGGGGGGSASARAASGASWVMGS